VYVINYNQNVVNISLTMTNVVVNHVMDMNQPSSKKLKLCWWHVNGFISCSTPQRGKNTFTFMIWDNLTLPMLHNRTSLKHWKTTNEDMRIRQPITNVTIKNQPMYSFHSINCLKFLTFCNSLAVNWINKSISIAFLSIW
jgi:hypothetical protein